MRGKDPPNQDARVPRSCRFVARGSRTRTEVAGSNRLLASPRGTRSPDGMRRPVTAQYRDGLQGVSLGVSRPERSRSLTMANASKDDGVKFVGVDLGDKFSRYCSL